VKGDRRLTVIFNQFDGSLEELGVLLIFDPLEVDVLDFEVGDARDGRGIGYSAEHLQGDKLILGELI